MKNHIVIKPLIEHQEAIPALVNWFVTQWPEYYGVDGKRNAQKDIENYANNDTLPLGLVAYKGNQLCGFMALKTESFASLTYSEPWVGAGFVLPEMRAQGIGTRLLSAIENKAASMGYSQLYSGTAKSHGLLQRAGWTRENEVFQDGKKVTIYTKKL